MKKNRKRFLLDSRVTHAFKHQYNMEGGTSIKSLLPFTFLDARIIYLILKIRSTLTTDDYQLLDFYFNVDNDFIYTALPREYNYPSSIAHLQFGDRSAKGRKIFG